MYQDPVDKAVIHNFDLNKEKVVEEWEADGVKDIMSYCPIVKNGQVTGEQTLLACTTKGIHLLDPRVGKK